MPRTRLLPLLTLVAACGCASFDGLSGLNPFGKKYVTADAENPACEVACIWQPGEGVNEKGIPARGFSGQVFFFTRKNAEPVLVDGTMRVYLFADRGTPEERGQPIKQFDFTPEAWNLHATMTALGPGYGVFIPYPQTEPYQVRCQLRARFIPKEGPTLWSEAVTITLEGPPQPGAEPAWWSNVDRNQSPPTVVDAKVTHESQSAEQIAASKSDSPAGEPAPRKLRTDTFSLDEIQQTAYEVPARRAPAAGASSAAADEEEDAEAPTVGELGGLDSAQLKELLRQQAQNTSERTETRPSSTRASQAEAPAAHPLRRKAARPAAPAPHPLTDEAGLENDEEATQPFARIRLGQGRSFARPAHPLSLRPAWTPPGSSLPPIDSAGSEATPVTPVRHDAGGVPIDESKSSDYGTWHPLGG